MAARFVESFFLRTWQRRGLAARLLWPLSALYGWQLHRRLRPWATGQCQGDRLPIPVVVIGNAVAGGSGKTPVVIALARALLAQGVAVGVVSRGWGRASQTCREVLPDSDPALSGDEPLLIRQRTGAPVFVARARAEAARALLRAYPATQIVLCDDALQHPQLARDLDICVFDERGIGNGWLLPAGPLREPWPLTPGAQRAPLVVLHGGQAPAPSDACLTRPVQRHLAAHAVNGGGLRVPLAELRGQPLVAVAGIAQPERFFDALRAQGLTLARCLPLPDHYDFSSWSWADRKGERLICTEKDAVKLWAAHPDALAVPLELDLPPAVLDLALSLIPARL